MRRSAKCGVVLRLTPLLSVQVTVVFFRDCDETRRRPARAPAAARRLGVGGPPPRSAARYCGWFWSSAMKGRPPSFSNKDFGVVSGQHDVAALWRAVAALFLLTYQRSLPGPILPRPPTTSARRSPRRPPPSPPPTSGASPGCCARARSTTPTPRRRSPAPAPLRPRGDRRVRPPSFSDGY